MKIVPLISCVAAAQKWEATANFQDRAMIKFDGRKFQRIASGVEHREGAGLDADARGRIGGQVAAEFQEQVW